MRHYTLDVIKEKPLRTKWGRNINEEWHNTSRLLGLLFVLLAPLKPTFISALSCKGQQLKNGEGGVCMGGDTFDKYLPILDINEVFIILYAFLSCTLSNTPLSLSLSLLRIRWHSCMKLHFCRHHLIFNWVDHILFYTLWLFLLNKSVLAAGGRSQNCERLSKHGKHNLETFSFGRVGIRILFIK